jgi:flagellar hook-basal body complex protein FliE
MAKELGILKIGTVSTDGTKIKANASIHKSIRYDRASELEEQLNEEISELMEKAEAADNDNGDDNDQLKGDLKRLKTLRKKVREAQEKLEEQKRTKPENQVNMTDSDSRIMRKNSRSEYSQSYNAQAVVDASGSMLVVGARVTNAGVDNKELVANIESIPEDIGSPDKVLADNGYIRKEEVENLQDKGIKVYLPVSCEGKFEERKHDFRPKKPPKAKAKESLPWIKEMAQQMQEKSSRDLYRLRKQTVEPVFGIVKEAMSFHQFLHRGIEKVNNEWILLMTAYNLKRIANILR